MKGFIAYPAGSAGKRPGVLVVHEWWGLNDYARSRARKLAEMGYVALAIDMYGDGKTGDASRRRQEVHDRSRSATSTPRCSASRRRRRCSASDPRVDGGKIAAIGYCFGGAMVLHMARIGARPRRGRELPRQPRRAGADAEGRLRRADAGRDRRRRSVRAARAGRSVQAGDGGGERELRAGDLPRRQARFTNPDATENGKKFKLPMEYNAEADAASWQKLRAIARTHLAERDRAPRARAVRIDRPAPAVRSSARRLRAARPLPSCTRFAAELGVRARARREPPSRSAIACARGSRCAAAPSSPKLGIFQAGSHRIADIPHCLVHHPLVNDVAAVLKQAMRELRIEPYADAPHRGLLRYVQVVIERESQRAQLVLVVNSDDRARSAALCERLTRAARHALARPVRERRTPCAATPSSVRRCELGDAARARCASASPAPTCSFRPMRSARANLDAVRAHRAAHRRARARRRARRRALRRHGRDRTRRSCRARRSVAFNEIGAGSLAGLRMGIDALPPPLAARAAVHAGPAAAHAGLCRCRRRRDRRPAAQGPRSRAAPRAVRRAARALHLFELRAVLVHRRYARAARQRAIYAVAH